MWSDKYRPSSVDEFTGNKKTATDLLAYKWKKPVILYGPTGIGKSVLAELIAKECDLQLVEISDENIANGRNIVETGTIFGQRKLVVIDNAEQIRNTKELKEIMNVSRNPLLLITTDYNAKKLSTIKRSCEKFQLKRPPAATIAKLLEGICLKEGVTVEKEVLTKIAENASGDLRAAINDLETLAIGKRDIKESDLTILDKRDRTIDIYNALSIIFMKKDIKESLQAIYDLSEQPQNTLLWIDENLPDVYKGRPEIKRSYEHLSRADIFLGRITSKQYWGFLRYANALMSSGITASRGEKISFSRYKFPFYIIRMSQTKKERGLKKSIGQKMSPHLHCSTKVVANEFIPLYRTLALHGTIQPEEFAQQYKLEEEEIEYLTAKA